LLPFADAQIPRRIAVGYTARGDIFEAEKLRVWLAKLGGRDWEVAHDGTHLVLVTPIESERAPKQDHTRLSCAELL
jgi:hypothetical protein